MELAIAVKEMAIVVQCWLAGAILIQHPGRSCSGLQQPQPFYGRFLGEVRLLSATLQLWIEEACCASENHSLRYFLWQALHDCVATLNAASTLALSADSRSSFRSASAVR